MKKILSGKKIGEPTKAIKFAELLMLVIAAILMSAMLTGCNTTQTLAAQFGAAPLPTKVARKLYGTCGMCALDVNCALCKATQNYNRKLAGAPASQKAQFPIVGTDWKTHQANLNYQAYQASQASQTSQTSRGIQNYGNYQSYGNPRNTYSDQSYYGNGY